MRIIKPEVKEIVFHSPEGYTVEQWLERAGRTCYKSEDKATEKSAPKFIRMLRDRGHHAMLEHCMFSVVVRVDRGITHEWVRHRLASYAQESTRYCNYNKGKFGSEITVVEYPWIKDQDGGSTKIHIEAALDAERHYKRLLDRGEPPQLARAVLPISVKTDFVVSTNAREWFHIFDMRADTPAHPMIKSIVKEILKSFNDKYPSLFEEKAAKFLSKESE